MSELTPITEIINYATGLQHANQGIIKSIIEDFRDEGNQLKKGVVLVELDASGVVQSIYEYMGERWNRMNGSGANFIEVVVKDV